MPKLELAPGPRGLVAGENGVTSIPRTGAPLLSGKSFALDRPEEMTRRVDHASAVREARSEFQVAKTTLDRDIG